MSSGVAPSTSAAWMRSLAPVLIFLGIALALHFVVGPALGPFRAKVLLDIGIAIILGVSLNIVNGYTGQFSIGHAGFMAVGGYTAALVTFYGSHKLWGSAAIVHGFLGPGELLFFAGTVAGALVAALFGYLVGLPSLRLRGDYLALVTLGFGEIIRVLITQTKEVVRVDPGAQPWSTLATSMGGALGFTGLPFYTSMFWVWFWVAVTLLVAYRLKESSHGRAFLSIREDEIAAEAMGIPTTSLKIRAFVISAAFAGIAGALFAHEIGTTLNPRELGFQKSFEVVIMVVLGGMGSISGTVLAATVLTMLPELLRELSEYRMIGYSLTLILVMLLRPQGLFGLHEIWKLPALRRFLGRS